MKLSKKDISLLADAIFKSVWDEDARNKKLNEEADKAWEKFKKTDKRKNLMKVFDEHEEISSIDVNTEEFYGMKRRYYGSSTLIRRGENETGYQYKDLYKGYMMEKGPNEVQLKKEIELELTIQAIGGGEVQDIMKSITTMLKKKYDL